MSERWRRELRSVDEVEPTHGLVERARAEGPRHVDAPVGPSVRSRIVAGVTAFAVFAAAAVLLWNGFHSGPTVQKTPVGHLAGSPTFGDGSVSFKPMPGWTILQGGTLSACATTASFVAEDVQQSSNLGPNTILGCRSTAAALPSAGVLVTVQGTDLYTWAQPNANFPATTIPPTLDPSSCGANSFEGQPRGTTECHVWITANDRELTITVWFGTESPGPDLMATAQQGLDSQTVAEPASLGNDIAFQPAKGWYDQAVTPTNGGAAFDLHSAWTSNVELAPYPGTYLPAGPTNDDIAHLPPDGVIVSVEQSISTRNPLPTTADYQPLALPLDLADARLVRGGWEGMTATNVSQLYLRGVVNGHPVIIQAFFRTTDPTKDLINQAQIGINRLVVVPAPPPTSALDDFGISMQLPDGWHGWLYAGDPTLVATTSRPANPFYAPQVGQNMGASDTTIVLDESTALQDLRWPAIDGPPQIGPDNLCDGCEVMDDGKPPAPGHVLYRDTFTSGDRAFDLYVEFGSAPTLQQLLDANAILQTLQIAPNPNPQQAPPGGTAVGTLPGGRPTVGANDANRMLSWTYGEHASMSVPAGWTGWTNLVTDSGEPLNLFALGSWNVPEGAYCAPFTALQQLPSDGVLVWIDSYHSDPPPGVQVVPWPQAPQVGPGTEPAAAPTDCTGGVPVQSFTWSLSGQTYSVHAAFGPAVTQANIQATEQALATFSTGP